MRQAPDWRKTHGVALRLSPSQGARKKALLTWSLSWWRCLLRSPLTICADLEPGQPTEVHGPSPAPCLLCTAHKQRMVRGISAQEEKSFATWTFYGIQISVSINKLFFGKRATSVCLHFVCDRFCTRTVELGGCDRDCVAHRAEAICCLALTRPQKSVCWPFAWGKDIEFQGNRIFFHFVW